MQILEQQKHMSVYLYQVFSIKKLYFSFFQIYLFILLYNIVLVLPYVDLKMSYADKILSVLQKEKISLFGKIIV